MWLYYCNVKHFEPEEDFSAANENEMNKMLLIHSSNTGKWSPVAPWGGKTLLSFLYNMDQKCEKKH